MLLLARAARSAYHEVLASRADSPFVEASTVFSMTEGLGGQY